MVDTTGAGDAFTGALAWRLAEGDALVTAVKQAGRDGLDPLLYDLAFVEERGGKGRTQFRKEDAGEIDARLNQVHNEQLSSIDTSGAIATYTAQLDQLKKDEAADDAAVQDLTYLYEI